MKPVLLLAATSTLALAPASAEEAAAIEGGEEIIVTAQQGLPARIVNADATNKGIEAEVSATPSPEVTLFANGSCISARLRTLAGPLAALTG